MINEILGNFTHRLQALAPVYGQIFIVSSYQCIRQILGTEANLIKIINEAKDFLLFENVMAQNLSVYSSYTF